MSNEVHNISERLHWVRITVYTEYSRRDVVDTMIWDGLPWATRMRFGWYFDYRAALLKVKYPKSEVEMKWGNSPAEGKSLILILKNKLSQKKGMVTKVSNALLNARKSWDFLFPIEEDILFKKAQIKLEKYKNEVQQIEEQLTKAS